MLIGQRKGQSTQQESQYSDEMSSRFGRPPADQGATGLTE
jgi:hypothetical protein